MDKITGITVTLGTFFTTLFAQDVVNTNMTSQPFAVVAASAVAGFALFVFKKYDAAQKNRIQTLEKETQFYRDLWIAEKNKRQNIKTEGES